MSGCSSHDPAEGFLLPVPGPGSSWIYTSSDGGTLTVEARDLETRHNPWGPSMQAIILDLHYELQNVTVPLSVEYGEAIQATTGRIIHQTALCDGHMKVGDAPWKCDSDDVARVFYGAAGLPGAFGAAPYWTRAIPRDVEQVSSQVALLGTISYSMRVESAKDPQWGACWDFAAADPFPPPNHGSPFTNTGAAMRLCQDISLPVTFTTTNALGGGKRPPGSSAPLLFTLRSVEQHPFTSKIESGEGPVEIQPVLPLESLAATQLPAGPPNGRLEFNEALQAATENHADFRAFMESGGAQVVHIYVRDARGAGVGPAGAPLTTNNEWEAGIIVKNNAGDSLLATVTKSFVWNTATGETHTWTVQVQAYAADDYAVLGYGDRHATVDAAIDHYYQWVNSSINNRTPVHILTSEEWGGHLHGSAYGPRQVPGFMFWIPLDISVGSFFPGIYAVYDGATGELLSAAFMKSDGPKLLGGQVQGSGP